MADAKACAYVKIHRTMVSRPIEADKIPCVRLGDYRFSRTGGLIAGVSRVSCSADSQSAVSVPAQPAPLNKLQRPSSGQWLIALRILVEAWLLSGGRKL